MQIISSKEICVICIITHLLTLKNKYTQNKVAKIPPFHFNYQKLTKTKSSQGINEVKNATYAQILQTISIFILSGMLSYGKSLSDNTL